MVPNVLRGKKNSASERLEKHTWLDASRDRLKPEAADRLHLAAHFVQLRNAMGVESETIETVEILLAGVLAMRRSKYLQDSLPNLVFKVGIRGGRNGRTRLIAHCNLSDCIAAGTILRVSKSRMV